MAENIYEKDELLGQYCEFHYGDRYFETENFPLKCVEKVKQVYGRTPITKALDIGCATGRSSLELASFCQEVIGIDYSHAFINVAETLLKEGGLKWNIVQEGLISEEKSIRLEDLNLRSAAEHVKFRQGDACALDEDLCGLDLVCGFNLICRLPEPDVFLNSVADRLKPGGMLALTTPATWLPAFTDRDKWIGGYYSQEERPIYTLDGLKKRMKRQFTLCAEPEEIPFVIRETSRKFQHSFAQFTMWQKN